MTLKSSVFVNVRFCYPQLQARKIKVVTIFIPLLLTAIENPKCYGQNEKILIFLFLILTTIEILKFYGQY